ncbi:polysaccharide deacetylase family protein [Streptomyces sp. 4N509B]|uniref:polysaccharide deacetylase family protein n=1 Tax=Streptomyces sp. 4N509B TaxID=3457413 RepID=UPI003FCF59FA
MIVSISLALVGTAGTAEAKRPDRPKPRADATIITSTASGGQTVAFTFDDGPNPPHTENLLAVLREHNVKAVFCLWGSFVQQQPNTVRQIVADGHTLCNHSMNHNDMGGWSASQIRADMEQTSAAIRSVVPGAQIPYFRAPYGSWGSQVAQTAASLGMQPLGWRMDIADWNPSSADQLAQRLLSGVTPGAVVLMHDGGGDRAATVQAVDMVIPQLKARGYTFDLPAPPR